MKKIFIGVDISKKNFDVRILNDKKAESSKYQYVEEQMEAFVNKLKTLSKRNDIKITMENTGIYHLRLADKLVKNDLPVAVVNALKIKCFAKMRMYRTKTDKADANLKIKCFAKMRMYRTKTDKADAKIEGLDNLPYCPEICKEPLNQGIDHVNKNIKVLEKELGELMTNHYQQELQILQSIPGVGERVASAIIAYFGKLENFQSAKHLVSFIGFDPAEKQSGSSIKGHARISKKGNRYLRKVLYMAAMSAYRFNPYCKELFDRLRQKGKSFKTAIIAVANKLLRQIFALLKKGKYFDYNYLKTA